MTQLNKKVIISAAGSGKTTSLVDQAIKNENEKTLILTYTIDNLNQIKRTIIDKLGIIPSNVMIQSWYSFLLNDCVRPYQNFVYDKKRIESIFFVNGQSTRYIKKTDVAKYFLQDGRDIFTDKISEFACLCNEKSSNKVIERLEKIYDSIYIDEVQDLAGYDFDFLDLLFSSNLNLVVVGDNRQATYFTNSSPKYKKYKGKNIIDLFKDWEKSKKCSIEYRKECHRCNQQICDFADLLYPDMPKTVSTNNKQTGHDGLHIIQSEDMTRYVEEYKPVILRYDKRTKTNGFEAINFGMSKGLTFDRVLIVPNGPIKKYLKTGEIKNIESSKAKFYVAVTRAKFSVTFVFDEKVELGTFRRYNFEN